MLDSSHIFCRVIYSSIVALLLYYYICSKYPITCRHYSCNISIFIIPSMFTRLLPSFCNLLLIIFFESLTFTPISPPIVLYNHHKLLYLYPPFAIPLPPLRLSYLSELYHPSYYFLLNLAPL